MTTTMNTTTGTTKAPGWRRATLLGAAAAFAAVDLAAKALAETRLDDASISLGLIDLRLAHNDGVAFSLGTALPAGVILAVTAAITAALLFSGWLHAAAATRWQLLAGAAVIGGATANLIDRSSDGVVTDFLHTGWWPTFNLADTFLILGMALLVLTWPRHPHSSEPPETGGNRPESRRRERRRTDPDPPGPGTGLADRRLG